jgi:hypothetical protein
MIPSKELLGELNNAGLVNVRRIDLYLKIRPNSEPFGIDKNSFHVPDDGRNRHHFSWDLRWRSKLE